MATNRAMLKEAIADAKAVKETAIANAKAALEEAFTPQLKSMFSLKLQEMELEEMDDTKMYEMEDEKSMEEGYDDMKEVDLEELLAELEKEEGVEENLYEAEEGEEDEESEESEEDEEEGEPMDLEDMTDEDLKDMIEDVIKDMIAAGELEAGHEGMENEEGAEEMEMSDDEEVDLAELLREIEEMEEPVDEIKIFGVELSKGKREASVAAMGEAIKKMAQEKGISLDKLDLQASLKDFKDRFNSSGEIKDIIQRRDGKYQVSFKELDPSKFEAYMQKLAAGTSGLTTGGGIKSVTETETELAEAYSTIETLKNELNEINLLNAKLLYSNKIFKSKNLNESQKVKVLSSFDKATTVGEVKMVFETLNEGIKVVKTTIKENLGSASKSTITPTAKKPIVESNEAFLRMQKLAGLI
jgi:hypothetical protein